MSCSSFDWKAYLVGEAASQERAAAEAHVRVCRNCREELERLKFTQTALLSLAAEEVPQRIAFVSDKVFEPRWWQTIWRSGPAMGFAAAAVLAIAILAHAFLRPVASQGAAATIDAARLEQRIEAQVNARLETAMAKAVSESEARQEQKFAKVLDDAEKRYQFQRSADLAAVEQTVRYYGQQMGRFMVASNDAVQTRSRP